MQPPLYKTSPASSPLEKARLRLTICLTVLTFILGGCSDGKVRESASGLATRFFSALKTSDEARAKALYSGFSNFKSYLKSDSAKVKEVLLNDTLVRVRVLNHFTNGLGKQSDAEIWLYMHRSPGDSLVIVDSKGLSSHSDDEEYLFGLGTGCIEAAKDTMDQVVLLRMKKASKLMVAKAVELYQELSDGCNVEDWSWETGYGRSASGKGIVRNNTSFSIPRLKYKVTYKDADGNEVTSDDGYVSVDAIEAGESRSFTTYTSYVGNASRASVRLEFDSDLMLKYVAKKEWTGKECTEYFSEHPDELEELKPESPQHQAL